MSESIWGEFLRNAGLDSGSFKVFLEQSGLRQIGEFGEGYQCISGICELRIVAVLFALKFSSTLAAMCCRPFVVATAVRASLHASKA